MDEIEKKASWAGTEVLGHPDENLRVLLYWGKRDFFVEVIIIERICNYIKKLSIVKTPPRS